MQPPGEFYEHHQCYDQVCRRLENHLHGRRRAGHLWANFIAERLIETELERCTRSLHAGDVTWMTCRVLFVRPQEYLLHVKTYHFGTHVGCGVSQLDPLEAKLDPKWFMFDQCEHCIWRCFLCFHAFQVSPISLLLLPRLISFVLSLHVVVVVVQMLCCSCFLGGPLVVVVVVLLLVIVCVPCVRASHRRPFRTPLVMTSSHARFFYGLVRTVLEHGLESDTFVQFCGG